MKKTADLTEGPVGKQLIAFALPFLGSSLIQQLYNTVDLMFVGRLIGTEASAAVGASSLLVTLLVGFFTGMSVGIGIISAHAFGAGNSRELHDIIHTAAGFTIAGSVVLMTIGWICSPVFLAWMNTPDSIMPLALTYIRVYFISVFSVIAYNIASGILRSLGDSRSPMIYQFFGGAVNVATDALFIAVLKWGVAGAALATLFSQTTAALLCTRQICRLDDSIRLRPRRIRIDFQVLLRILRIGIPAAVQAMVITLSNLVVQSQINILGVESIAAFTAYFKVENFIYLPIMAFGQANTAFVGQNTGAGKWDRVTKSVRFTLFSGSCTAIVIAAALLIFSRTFFCLFSSDDSVIALGGQIALRTFPFYFLYVFLETYSGTIRGSGRTLPPMLIVVINMCAVRIAVLMLLVHIFHSAAGVALVYPVTWACTVFCLAVYYRFGHWRPNSI